MRMKTVALLAVAVGCGLVAMLGVRQAMNGKQSGEREKKVSVLVAVTEIPVGTPLTPENVTFRDVAVTLVPEDAVLTQEQYAERSARVPIQPSDFITLSKLTEPGMRGKSVQIPTGMRVVSVKVNDTQTHSNMLAPGDRVDVLVTYSSRGQRGMNTKTKTLLEHVELFATGNQTVTDGHKEKESQVKNVSLLVTPEQASYVYLAERKGELSLVWRNIADDEQVQVGAVDERLMEELSGTIDKGSVGDIGSPYGTEDVATEPALSTWLTQQEPVTTQPEPTPEPLPPTITIAKAEPEKPPVPTWKLMIYAGENAETVEFELPQEKLPVDGAGTTAGDELGTVSAEDAGLTGGTEPVSAPTATEGANPFGSILEQFRKLPFAK